MLKFKYNIFVLILFIIPFLLFVGGTMPYFLFYILLLLYLVPLIHCFFGYIFIKGKINIPSKTLYSGEYIDLSYEIINTSFLPLPYIEIKNEIGSILTNEVNLAHSISLYGKQVYKKEEKIFVSKRGNFTIGEIVISIKDIFGIVSIDKKLSENISLMVYPQIIDLEYFSILGSQQMGDLIINDNSFEDRSRINSIRDYSEGDSIKDIHWKLTAKKGVIVIKDYENRGDINNEIIINNCSNYFNKDTFNRVEDKIVESAISIVNYCLNRNIVINLGFLNNSERITIEGQNPSDIKVFLEALAGFKANGSENYLLNIESTSFLNQNSNLIFITPILDKNIGAQAIELKMKNHSLIYIIVTDIKNQFNFLDKDIEAQLVNEGIPIYILDANSNIKDILEVAYG